MHHRFLIDGEIATIDGIDFGDNIDLDVNHVERQDDDDYDYYPVDMADAELSDLCDAHAEARAAAAEDERTAFGDAFLGTFFGADDRDGADWFAADPCWQPADDAHDETDY
jgi:hypothetical protein